MKKLQILHFSCYGIFSIYAGVLPVENTSVVKTVADAIKWNSESIDVGKFLRENRK
jgi:hypothetical protein